MRTVNAVKIKCSKLPIIILVHNEILIQKLSQPTPPVQNLFSTTTLRTAALSNRKLLQPSAVNMALYFTYQCQFTTSDTHTTFVSVSVTEKLKH